MPLLTGNSGRRSTTNDSINHRCLRRPMPPATMPLMTNSIGYRSVGDNATDNDTADG
jgi:hypothetical protein